ncbi:hypothetical protein Q5P01_021352 [Channa striata]|uniref:Uncharacterized protein n=1 Tax=Channa striata TaxID=64152 RepID=A0AA88LU17_CHASR|nr:hypothetical protein Q5P01_021352 [Channa striata]
MFGDGEGTVWDRVARPHRDCMCYLGPPTTLMPIGMRKSPDVSPRRLSDISPQLRQLKYLVVDEAIKEDLKSSRSVEDINSASIEERILRITGYYGYQPWSTSYKTNLAATVLHGDKSHTGDTLVKIAWHLLNTVSPQPASNTHGLTIRAQ